MLVGTRVDLEWIERPQQNSISQRMRRELMGWRIDRGTVQGH
jgi:hypothetical protein